MDAIYFPSDIPNPEYPLEYELEDTSIASKFEDGSVQTRRKFTKSRDTFTVRWNKLPRDKFNVLMNFIKNIAVFRCNAFYWINPASLGSGEEDVRMVRIVEVSELQLVELNYYSVKIKLQEI